MICTHTHTHPILAFFPLFRSRQFIKLCYRYLRLSSRSVSFSLHVAYKILWNYLNGKQKSRTHTHTLWERAELIKIQLNTFQQYFRQWYKFLARHYNYISGFPAVRGGIFNMLAHTRSHTHTHTDKFAHQYICQTICRLIKFFFPIFIVCACKASRNCPKK